MDDFTRSRHTLQRLALESQQPDAQPFQRNSRLRRDHNNPRLHLRRLDNRLQRLHRMLRATLESILLRRHIPTHPHTAPDIHTRAILDERRNWIHHQHSILHLHNRFHRHILFPVHSAADRAGYELCQFDDGRLVNFRACLVALPAGKLRRSEEYPAYGQGTSCGREVMLSFAWIENYELDLCWITGIWFYID